MDGTPQLDLQLFGYPEMRAGGRPVLLPLRRALAVLIYVAEAHAPVSREALASLLWPEADETAAHARLRRLLHRMHQHLGAGVIAADRSAVSIAPDLQLRVDTQAFEQACSEGEFEKASSLYRAAFLESFSIQGCPEFDEWAFFRREALRSRLIHALERLIDAHRLRGQYRELIIHASKFVAIDPLSETAHGHLIAGYLLAGDTAAAQHQYQSCALLLQRELGISPGPSITELMNAPERLIDAGAVPTSYVSNEGVHLAYQVTGRGQPDIVFVPGFVSHVERVWGEPYLKAFLTALSGIGRLIIFDRRGVGLSDRVGEKPTVEATAKDIGAVMAAAGSRNAILFGASEGGPGCICFAAKSPERLRGLILCGSLAKGSWAEDYPFALTLAQYEIWLRRLIAQWGGPAGIETFAPALAGNRLAEAWWADLLRSASSPGAVRGVLEAMRDVDVRSFLPRLRVPTLVLHRTGDRAVRVETGRHLAAAINKARFVELPGDDHWIWIGDQARALDEIRAFVRTL
jgi:DNA-binding SARP family transcriptional activator/pimeloyl-ACP methyl ester carboxylesterase